MSLPSAKMRTNNYNYKSNGPRLSSQENRGGSRPTAEPQSIGLIFVTLILHLCKKSLLFETRLKAVLYLGAVFFGSLVADAVPMPKTYFARSNNFLNRYFIKWAWAWLLVTTVPWVIMTAHTVSCGRRAFLLRHLGRLIFATCAWMMSMNIFHYIENNYGRCLKIHDPLMQDKSKCLQAGGMWSCFDISGHTFIIIYSCLILSEEAYSLVGWEGIKQVIVEEEYIRKSTKNSFGYLRYLSVKDLDFLKKTHLRLTPYLRTLFIVMTIQQIFSEVMLIATVLYYHTVMEKFFGCITAILIWYASYRWLFKVPGLGCQPGDGIFTYNPDTKEKVSKKYFETKAFDTQR